MQECCCHLVLTLCRCLLKTLNVKQEYELSACWNTMNRNIFGITNENLSSVSYGVWTFRPASQYILQQKTQVLHAFNRFRSKFLSDIFWIFSEVSFAYDVDLCLFFNNWFGFHVDIVDLFQSTLSC